MGEEWYGYVYKKNHTKFEDPKLLVPSIATGACFAADLEGQYYFVGSGGGGGGGYGIILNPEVGISPLFLLGLLNSRLADWYLHTVSTSFRGGYIALNRQFIEHLPISEVNLSAKSERNDYEGIIFSVNRILTTKKNNPKADTLKLEQEIDERVYRLYGLTKDEIKIVEEGS